MQQRQQFMTILMVALIYVSAQLAYIQMRYIDTSALTRVADYVVNEFREANPPREVDRDLVLPDYDPSASVSANAAE